MDDLEFEKFIIEHENETERMSKLSKSDLSKEILHQDENKYLVAGSPDSEHFLSSLRLGKTQKERREIFFNNADKIPLGYCKNWTQKAFNENERIYRDFLKKNSSISDKQLLSSFRKKVVNERFLALKEEIISVRESRLWREKQKKEDARLNREQNLTILKGLSFIIFIIFWIIGIINYEGYEDPFMKNCLTHSTEQACKATKKRNKDFMKRYP